MRGDLFDGRHLAQFRENVAPEVLARIVGREEEFLRISHRAEGRHHDVAAHASHRELNAPIEPEQRGEREDDERREQRDRQEQ